MSNLIEKVEALITSYDNSPQVVTLGNTNVMEHLLGALGQYTRSDVQQALSESKFAARFAVAATIPPNQVIEPQPDLNAVEWEEFDIRLQMDNGVIIPRTPYNIAQAILSLLDELDDLEELPTGFSTLHLRPRHLAQLIMERLPVPGADDERIKMEDDERLYWLKVADYFGPDWIQSFRKVGAFMQKVESF